MTGTFRPEIWSQALAQQLTRRPHWQQSTERDRKGHSVVTPLTADELQARQKAIDAWRKLTEELVVKEWLIDAEDGHYPNDALETRTWVYDETVEEHQARVDALPPLPDTVTFPVRRGPFNDDSLNTIRKALNTES